MKRVSKLVALLLAGAAPAVLAQEPQPADAAPPVETTTPAVAVAAAAAVAPTILPAPMPANYSLGFFSLAGSYSDTDRDSSKFLEYRDLPDGVTAPHFRFQGRRGELDYDALGRFVRPEDQRYGLHATYRTFEVDASYDAIPHRFGFGGNSLLDQVSPGVFRVDEARRAAIAGAVTHQFAANRTGVNFTFLRGLVDNAGLPYRYDLELLRKRGKVDLNLTRGKPVDLTITYFREDRNGTRAAAGTAFGFNNVVETPEPVDYTTQDMSARAEYAADWGLVHGLVRYNWFDNAIAALLFDNPFRLTDASDSGAYQAPGSGSIGGARFGAMALPPSNDALTGTVGGLVKLPGKTRLSADFTLGRWTQDEPFLAYTTNTAINRSTGAPIDNATQVAALPVRSLDGRADIFSMNFNLVSRPIRNVTFTARTRHYELDNKTAPIEIPGYARFDAAWSAVPRVSVPYGFGTFRTEATVAYDFGKLSLETGYRRATFERTFRETEETTEDAFLASANLRTGSRFVLRGSYERAVRDYDHYHAGHSEHASFVNAANTTNLLALDPEEGGPIPGRYDQAHRTFDRVNALATVMPHDKVSLTVGYLFVRESFGEDLAPGQYQMGLTRAQYDVISADLGFVPTERASLYAFYSREINKNDQLGRQSGATPSLNPLDNWSSNVKDTSNTFGGGATLTLVPDKWTLDLSGRYQETDGFNGIDAALSGAAGTGGVLDLLRYDDTKVVAFNGELRYDFQKNWTAALGGLYEDYTYEDDNSIGDLDANYLTGSLFLNPYDGTYNGKALYFRLAYRW